MRRLVGGTTPHFKHRLSSFLVLYPSSFLWVKPPPSSDLKKRCTRMQPGLKSFPAGFLHRILPVLAPAPAILNVPPPGTPHSLLAEVFLLPLTSRPYLHPSLSASLLLQFTYCRFLLNSLSFLFLVCTNCSEPAGCMLLFPQPTCKSTST